MDIKEVADAIKSLAGLQLKSAVVVAVHGGTSDIRLSGSDVVLRNVSALSGAEGDTVFVLADGKNILVLGAALPTSGGDE